MTRGVLVVLDLLDLLQEGEDDKRRCSKIEFGKRHGIAVVLLTIHDYAETWANEVSNVIALFDGCKLKWDSLGIGRLR